MRTLYKTLLWIALFLFLALSFYIFFTEQSFTLDIKNSDDLIFIRVMIINVLIFSLLISITLVELIEYIIKKWITSFSST